MGTPPTLDREAAGLVLAALDGAATPEQTARLESLLLERPGLVAQVVDLVGQETWLRWSCRDPWAVSRVPSPGPACVPAATRGAGGGWSARRLAALAACSLMAGALAGYTARGPLGPAGADASGADPLGEVAARPMAGRIVAASACRWGADAAPPVGQPLLGQRGLLRPGESLNLLEGIARVRLEWPDGLAELDIEGPAGVVLNASGGCTLSHGRLAATVTAVDGALSFETPNGRVDVSRPAELGLVVDGRDVTVHVFRGAASVVVPWATHQFESQQTTLHGGESLTLAGAVGGALTASRGESSRGDFISQTPMTEDQLRIPAGYVRDVLALDPLLYWRFEDPKRNGVENEVGPGLRGRINGRVGWSRNGDNQFVSLGLGVADEELTAHIVTDETLEAPPEAGEAAAGQHDQGAFARGYTLEAWIKPSHYHLGAVAALLLPSDDPNRLARHGLVLELGGPRTTEPFREQPGKVRFLHRSPPSEDPNLGASCFSPQAYKLRRWQHVAAVKTPHELRLYLDGELVTQEADPTRLAPGLRLMVGQIDNRRSERQFVGQLDELTFYPFPLPAEVVRRHYRLVRPAPDPAANPAGPQA